MQRFSNESYLYGMKQMISLAILLCGFNVCSAQTYLEIFTGYQTDINSSKTHFNLINSGIQITIKKSRRYEIMLQFQKGWGIPGNSTGPAYTTNPGLPLQSPAEKTITPSVASFLLGNKFVVTGKNFPGAIAFVVYGGFSYQKIKVEYQYDKNNYTVLNPDRTKDGTGLFFSTGIEYMKEVKNGRFFFQVLAGPPPTMKGTTSNISFNFIAPLSLNAGYSFILKRAK